MADQKELFDCGKRKPAPDGFDEFWRYARRVVCKADARRAYPKAVADVMQTEGLSRPDAEVWLLRAWIAYNDTKIAQTKNHMYPATWLNGAHYYTDMDEWEKRYKFLKSQEPQGSMTTSKDKQKLSRERLRSVVAKRIKSEMRGASAEDIAAAIDAEMARMPR